MIEWPIERVKVSQLKPFDKNPRTITPQAYASLKDKIERLGFNNPIQATHDYRIIGGHQRCKILKELGVKEISIARAPYEMTDDQFREALIESNVSDGQWDFAALEADFGIDNAVKWGVPEDWFPKNFEPVEEITQGSLDIKKHHICPECGHEFVTA